MSKQYPYMRILLLILILATSLASEAQIYADKDGFLRIRPNKCDTVYITKDVIVYKDTTIYKTIYKDTVIYRDTCTYEQVPTGYLTLASIAPLTISGQSNIIIENKRITNAPGASAVITNSSNITFRNCFFDGAAMEAITLYNCKNIIIEKCLFARVTTGVYASTSQGVIVRENQFVNVRMRADNSSRGQFVQFNAVTGVGNIIENNKGENFYGESNPEDLISCFRSGGTATSPLIIRGNIFRGGGPSLSGGGIVAGDYGGDYITIENNQLVNPGNYGIAVAGGNYNILNNNKVYSDFHTWNNAGVIIWGQQGTACSNVTYTNNRINWPYKLGGQNNLFFEGNCGTLKQSGNVYNESLAVMMPDFPKHLIDFVTADELIEIRK